MKFKKINKRLKNSFEIMYIIQILEVTSESVTVKILKLNILKREKN